MFILELKALLSEATGLLATAKAKLAETIEAADKRATRADDITQPVISPMRRHSDSSRR